MNPKKDAFGQEIMAFFQGKKSFEVIERKDGYVGLSCGAPFYFADFKDWSDIEKKAIKFVRGKILDIGAGAGRVSLYLQNKGFDVTAIDNSPLSIKVCRKRGIKKASLLSIEDILELRPKKFDTIIMFGNGFGLLGNYKKSRKILKELYEITGKDALILAGSDGYYKSNNLNNKKSNGMPEQFRLRIRFKEYIGNWFDFFFVSRYQMERILKGTGWRVKFFINSKKSKYVGIIEKIGDV